MKSGIYLCAPVLIMILSGCQLGSQLIKIKDQPQGYIHVGDIRHVESSDTYTEISGTLAPLVGTEPQIALGIRASIHPLSIGEFKLAASHLFPFSKDEDAFRASNPSVLRSRLLASFEYPLIKKKSTVETSIPLMMENGDIESYYTIMDVDYITILGLHLGGGYSANYLESTDYAGSLRRSLGHLSFPNEYDDSGTMAITTGNYLARVGLSYTWIFGTSFSVSEAEHDFTGSRFTKWSVYADLQGLLHSQVDDINFTYRYFDMPSASMISVSERVNPAKFLKKQFVGFAVGVDHTIWLEPRYNMNAGFFFEFGALPGYSEGYSQCLYGQFGLHVGFGNVKRSN